MKVVTGNRLTDGHPVYRAADGAWTEDLAQAELMDDEELAASALGAAREEETVVVGAYLINVEAPGAPVKRERVREDIRYRGPTTRPDLGRQAEKA